MANEILTTCEINAHPATVWGILTDFSHYPEWNPFITRASGVPNLGEKLEIFLQDSPNSKPTRFRPTVLAADPETKLQWLGSLWIRGLFDGKHTFELSSASGNSGVATHFVQREEFSGLLTVLLPRNFYRNTKLGFEAMNLALKNRAEKVSAEDTAGQKNAKH